MPEVKAPGIYAIQNWMNRKVYIGSARRIGRRLVSHLRDLRKGKHSNRHLQGAFNKHGEASFDFRPLVNTENSKHCLLSTEQMYIDLFSSSRRANGYNLAPRAGSNQGVIASEQARRNMSRAHIGKPNGRKGFRLTEEQRQHLRQINTGKIMTEEAKARISATLKGRSPRGRGFSHSDEHKKRIGEISKASWLDPTVRASRLAGMSGRECKEETREKIGASNARCSYFVTFPDGHVESVNNLVRFCREHGLGSGFHNVLSGRCKHYKGFLIIRQGAVNA